MFVAMRTAEEDNNDKNNEGVLGLLLLDDNIVEAEVVMATADDEENLCHYQVMKERNEVLICLQTTHFVSIFELHEQQYDGIA